MKSARCRPFGGVLPGLNFTFGCQNFGGGSDGHFHFGNAGRKTLIKPKYWSDDFGGEI